LFAIDCSDLTRNTEKDINIYVGLTEMQCKWYWSVLEKDIDAVNGKPSIHSRRQTSLNCVIGLTGENTAHEHGYAGGQSV
jgi:SWI/SNF-related matrix-associated actin-dependent regulator of chromatin subfamily A member 5